MTGLAFPEIDPIAIHFTEGFGIRWYALAYLVGILGGWFYASYLANKLKRDRPNKDDIDNLISWIVFGIILGGRFGYVLFYNLPEYLDDPLSIFYVWEGGMSFHGGFIGVLVAIAFYARQHKIPFFVLGDIFAAVAPIGLFFGRVANFVNGELFGRVSTMDWAVRFPHGGGVPRHPSQLYEALLEGALLFVVLFLLQRKESVRNTTGVLSGVFIAGYGISRFIIEFFREPDMQIGFILEYFSLGQLLSLPMIMAGVYLVYYARSKRQQSA